VVSGPGSFDVCHWCSLHFQCLKTSIAAANSLWLGYGLVSFCQFAGECEYFVQCRIELRSDSLHEFQRRIATAVFAAADTDAVEPARNAALAARNILDLVNEQRLCTEQNGSLSLVSIEAGNDDARAERGQPDVQIVADTLCLDDMPESHA